MAIWAGRVCGALALVGVVGVSAAHAGLASGQVESVGDMPGAIVVDIAVGTIFDPLGPFVFGSGAGAVTATAVNRDVDTGFIQDPAMPGFFDNTFSCNLFPEWCGGIDPAVNPGDFMGRYDTNRELIVTFDAPVAGAGMSFYSNGSGGANSTGSTITAYDGPQGTGNIIGAVTSPNTSAVCCPFSSSPPWYFIYFRGVTSVDANIRSIVVTPTNASNGWGIDTIAVVPGGSDPCAADTNGDGLLTPADFNAWILAFNNQTPACDQNGDGLCTPSDFNAWILNFNAGCD